MRVFKDVEVKEVCKEEQSVDVPEVEYSAKKVCDLQWGVEDDDLDLSKDFNFKVMPEYVKPEFQIYESDVEEEGLDDLIDLELDMEAFLIQ